MDKRLIMVFGMAALMLCGCARVEEEKEARPVTITVWNYYTGAQQEAFNRLAEEFNQTRGKELGIEIKATSEGSVNDLESSVLAAAKKEVGAKEVPNIFAAYSDTAWELDRMGFVADLSPYFTEEEKAEYIESYLAEGDLDGNGGIKIFPVAKATEIFMLNQTDWDKFAAATGTSLTELETIEGVTEVAARYYEWTDSLTEEPDDGKAFFGRDAMANYMVIGARQLGTELVTRTESGEAVIDFPEDVVRRLWDNYYVPYIKGHFSSIGRFRSDDVKTGNVISFVGSSSSATFFPSKVILDDEQSYPIQTGVLAAPKFAGGEAIAVSQGAGMVVTKADDALVEASVEFLKWFTDTQKNIEFSLASGYLPVKKEANDLDVICESTGKEDSVTRTLEVSVGMINDNEMYTTKTVKNGSSIRKILEYSMSDKAVKDREKIVREIAGGRSADDAVKEYDTDENFRQWYESTKAELEAAVTGQ